MHTVGGPRGTVARAPVPILVELFTSEGCSSCPPADVFLQRLVDSQPLPDVQIVALGQHVTYWDHQGWRDRFASPALTERQERYGAALHVEPVYTPQMVVDGRFQFAGSDTKAGRQAIERTMGEPHGSVAIAFAGSVSNRLSISLTASQLPGLSRTNRADIVVAVTEDGLQSSVKAGENRGRQLFHAAVVRRMTTVGEAAGDRADARTDISLDREWQRSKLKIVAFVQERSSRHVLASGVAAVQAAGR